MGAMKQLNKKETNVSNHIEKTISRVAYLSTTITETNPPRAYHEYGRILSGLPMSFRRLERLTNDGYQLHEVIIDSLIWLQGDIENGEPNEDVRVSEFITDEVFTGLYPTYEHRKDIINKVIELSIEW